MKIKVRFLQRAGELVPNDKKVITVELHENSTLKNLLEYIRDKISRRLGEGIIEKRLILTILVNSRVVGNLNYELEGGDSVVFLSPEMGG